MDADSVKISVVIPVYKSAPCLPELLRQLTDQLEQIPGNYEIILVDDDSPDDSWNVIQELVSRYPQITASRLMRNSGQARATLCGFSHARGQTVVTMDDDLQHRPDQLPKLIDALDNNPDVDCVFGYFDEKQHAGYRNLGSRIIRWVNARAFGLPREIRSSSFRAMRRPIAQALATHGTANPAIPALVYGTTRRIISVPVEHAPRHAGESNYTLSKQLRLALDNICNVSMLPLRAVSVMGLAICFLGAVFVANVLVRYMLGRINVPGWTTVVILVSFFSGITLLSLGIIGEYMVRVLREVHGGPRYLERETIGRRSAADRPGD
jgi:glycosyltransferase involved in cell wall biosynthesis